MKRPQRLLPLALLLAGCGMYGDLYLEEEQPPAEAETAPGAEETDDDEDDPAGGS